MVTASGYHHAPTHSDKKAAPDLAILRLDGSQLVPNSESQAKIFSYWLKVQVMTTGLPILCATQKPSPNRLKTAQKSAQIPPTTPGQPGHNPRPTPYQPQPENGKRPVRRALRAAVRLDSGGYLSGTSEPIHVLAGLPSLVGWVGVTSRTMSPSLAAM